MTFETGTGVTGGNDGNLVNRKTDSSSVFGRRDRTVSDPDFDGSIKTSLQTPETVLHV